MIKIGEVKVFVDFNKFNSINYYIVENENNFGIRVENETTNQIIEINNITTNEYEAVKLVKKIVESYVDFEQIRYLIEDNIA